MCFVQNWNCHNEKMRSNCVSYPSFVLNYNVPHTFFIFQYAVHHIISHPNVCKRNSSTNKLNLLNLISNFQHFCKAKMPFIKPPELITLSRVCSGIYLRSTARMYHRRSSNAHSPQMPKFIATTVSWDGSKVKKKKKKKWGMKSHAGANFTGLTLIFSPDGRGIARRGSVHFSDLCDRLSRCPALCLHKIWIFGLCHNQEFINKSTNTTKSLPLIAGMKGDWRRFTATYTQSSTAGGPAGTGCQPNPWSYTPDHDEPSYYSWLQSSPGGGGRHLETQESRPRNTTQHTHDCE